MNFMRIITTIAVLGILTVFISCTGDGSSGKTPDKKEDIDGTQNSDNGKKTKTYYLIPSPEELFRFIHDGELKFSNKVVNPTKSINDYVSTRDKELNFGVYSADLAYVASFNKYQQSIDYLGVVRRLSDEIGISTIFDKNLVGRIDNITDDKDSLLKVTNDTYLSIVAYLEDVQRQESLAQIVTGGWVESIYVVANLLDSYESNPKIINLLAEQKGILENLIKYLEQRKNDKNVQSTLNDLQPIVKFYASLKSENKKPEEIDKNKKDGTIVVGNNTKVVMDKVQFATLKMEITKLRNKITKL